MAEDEEVKMIINELLQTSLVVSARYQTTKYLNLDNNELIEKIICTAFFYQIDINYTRSIEPL